MTIDNNNIVGKTIKAGENAKYIIKAIEGDKLITEFTFGNNAPMVCPLPKVQLEKMLEAGKWTIEGTATTTESKSEPKADNPNGKTKAPQYTCTEYVNKKGKKCARINGVSDTDEAYTNAAEIHASGSYEYVGKKGDKRYFLAFGSRYAKVAKDVCDAMNAGKPFADLKAIIEARTEERANATAYTAEQVAEMLRKVMDGGDIPADIKQAMAA